METLNTNTFPLALPPYTQLICQYDPERRALWAYLNPTPRPCFTPILLSEIRDLQKRLARSLVTPGCRDNIGYLVYASATPSVFNLGGDVELFASLVGASDRSALRDYGRQCIDAVYANVTSLGIESLTTIALIQGTALGGGLEGALSCNVVVAERSAPAGFPEILFNLFPGMGAMSLLSRKIEPAKAQRIILDGDILDGRTLWEIGVVDELAPDGEGMHKVNEVMRRHERQASGRLAMHRVFNRVRPLAYEELLDVVEIWVDAAMRLTPRDIRVMNRIVAAQSRLTDKNGILETTSASATRQLEAVA